MNDLPTFTANAYANRSGNASNLMAGTSLGTPTSWRSEIGFIDDAAEYKRRVHQFIDVAKQQENQNMAAVKAALRIVRVFLVDPDDRIPIDKRVLYCSDDMTTDATDQELFFGIPVNDLLKDHNAMRASVEWEEKTSEGTKSKTGLKEVRIRDLIMSVTTIASFDSRSAA